MSLAKAYLGDRSILAVKVDPTNPNRQITLLRDERELVSHGTFQYFLLPNAMLCYQTDHFELWRFEPIDVRTTKVTTSVYANSAPVGEKADRYLRKNLQLLLDVTGGEDFPLIERVQSTLDSGALPAVVYGRIEPSLVHFHAQIDKALVSGGLE